jgi:hypothetical protein
MSGTRPWDVILPWFGGAPEDEEELTLRLGSHPEMERPALREQINADRSAGATMSNPV